jgi:Zn-dependent protease
MNTFPYWFNLLIIPSLLLGYTAHELGHALAAYFLGDTSQAERGQISLNPLKHISWFGALAFIVFGLGWPKMLRVNPFYFKRKHRDMALAAFAGPLTSLTVGLAGLVLTLSIAASLVYLTGAATDQVLAYIIPVPNQLPITLNAQAGMIALTGYVTLTNLWLAFVSLLPLPGLDGFTIAVSLVAWLRERGQASPVLPKPQPRLDFALMTESPLLMSQQKRRNAAADIHFKAGADYHQANQFDDAIARYRQAIKNDPRFGPAYVNMGLAYLAKGDRKKAIQSFRGATQYADDQKSQQTAWYQLHQLSEVTPVDPEAARQDMAEMGASPWTDTHPNPNWLGLAVSVGLLLVSAIGLYGYLLAQLVEMLKR